MSNFAVDYQWITLLARLFGVFKPFFGPRKGTLRNFHLFVI